MERLRHRQRRRTRAGMQGGRGSLPSPAEGMRHGAENMRPARRASCGCPAGPRSWSNAGKILALRASERRFAGKVGNSAGSGLRAAGRMPCAGEDRRGTLRCFVLSRKSGFCASTFFVGGRGRGGEGTRSPASREQKRRGNLPSLSMQGIRAPGGASDQPPSFPR